ncbi:helix-turn-helix domain-containing protein, partial [Bacteroides ovatus]
ESLGFAHKKGCVSVLTQPLILEAKVLLKHSNLLVYQISDELNFPNPSFFSKFFKRMTGMTPHEYQFSK